MVLLFLAFLCSSNRMRLSLWCCLFSLVAVLSCSRSEEPATEPAPAPEPPTATKTGPLRVEAPGLEIGDDDATIVVDGFQFFMQPTEPDIFEIDADATQFIGYAPMIVDFGATALSGTPPVTYSWNFGDGTELGTGDRATHIFEKTGRMDVFVTGTDAAGDEANVQLALIVFSKEEWATARNLDIDSLPTPTPRP